MRTGGTLHLLVAGRLLLQFDRPRRKVGRLIINLRPVSGFSLFLRLTICSLSYNSYRKRKKILVLIIHPFAWKNF